MEGLGASLSAKEATEFISVNDVEEGFERVHFGVGLVPMPLEVSAHPEDPPTVLCPHEGRLGDRRFHLSRLVLPVRTNLEDFDAVAIHAIANIELISNVLWWAASTEKLRKRLLAAPEFDFGEGHARDGTGSA